MSFIVEGSGALISLRITKKEGVPVTLVPEGTPAKVGLNTNKTTAAIQVRDLKSDPDCFKVFKLGKTQIGRYSQSAVRKIRDLLATRSADEIWSEYITSR